MRRLFRFTLALIASASAGYAPAQSGNGQFAITHSVITPAATLSGGKFGLSGSVGQAVAASSGAGTYQLLGGFSAANTVTDRIFANGFEP